MKTPTKTGRYQTPTAEFRLTGRRSMTFRSASNCSVYRSPLADIATNLQFPTSQIGFVVMCAYFNSTKKFRNPRDFHTSDIEAAPRKPAPRDSSTRAHDMGTPLHREVQHLQVVEIVVQNRSMMRCGQETTTVPMRGNEETCCHDQKLPSLDLRRAMPGKDSKEERTFKRLDCATPGWKRELETPRQWCRKASTPLWRLLSDWM